MVQRRREHLESLIEALDWTLERATLCHFSHHQMATAPTPWPLVKIEVTAAWDFEGTSPETVRTALLGQLRRGNVSLTDVFNGEPTTTLTLEALKTVFRNVGYTAASPT